MKDIITTKDIAEMFEVSYNRACGILDGIKTVSDTLELKGKVHRQDYEMWLEVRKGQTEARGVGARTK